MRLGVNIDHVATLRNARGGIHPSPLRAAYMLQNLGVDGITVHLREDRRHIRDDDVFAIKKEVDVPLNFEMAATDDMVAIALDLLPHAVCLVPEKRKELTTEGGLDVLHHQSSLKHKIEQLRAHHIRVSLFVDADPKQIEAAHALRADIVELHTGVYVDAAIDQRPHLLKQLQLMATYATSLGLECHAGHGLTFDTVKEVARIHEIVELNIGHFIMGEAIFLGLDEVVRQMRSVIHQARLAQ